MPSTACQLDLDFVRRQFPSLQREWAFFDNAGGSQVPQTVVDRIGDYLLTSNVQLGASYGVSQLAGDRLSKATQAMATLIHAQRDEEVVFGGSTSLLLRILALSLVQLWQPGDEVIVTNCDHEANIGCWAELERHGIQVKWWRVNPNTISLELDDLVPLLTDRTRLVAVTHASNVVGTIHPIRAIADVVHQAGALLCVDGVAYAPHRLVDVQALDADFYVFSLYKVYGPHQAVLYGKYGHLLTLPSWNHYFIGQDAVPYKLQPGNINYELTYGSLGITDYLMALAQHHGLTSTNPREVLQQVFDGMAHQETRVGDRFLQFLATKKKVRVIGQAQMNPAERVPTIAFMVDGVDSATIPPRVDPHHIGIRYGDFYAKRLIADLGLADQNGVIRVSMVHYNTMDECDRLMAVLDPLLS
jgi:cysteine desulfurase family protein (TIGR01976 family)